MTVTRLTRVRLEATSEDERELNDYLTSCIEDIANLYGRSWHVRDAETQTTKHGYWGRITLSRTDLTDGEVKRVIR